MFKKLGPVMIATVAMAVLFTVPVEASGPPQCLGYPADWVGTDRNDSLWRDRMVDTNGDGVFVAVGKAGNDKFMLDQDHPVKDRETGEYWPQPPKTHLSYREYKACGWGGDDLFSGRWFVVDGGSDRDHASIEVCNPGDYIGISKVEITSVSVYDKPHPRRDINC